jgi:hypothetical protein
MTAQMAAHPTGQQLARLVAAYVIMDRGIGHSTKMNKKRTSVKAWIAYAETT